LIILIKKRLFTFIPTPNIRDGATAAVPQDTNTRRGGTIGSDTVS
jgi:hypothetical protein